MAQFLEGLSNMALWVAVPLQSSASKASAQQQPLVSALQGLRPMDSPTANGTHPQGHPHMGNGSSTELPDGHATASQAAPSSSGKALLDESCGGSAEWSQLWHQLHALAGFNPRLGVLLMVPTLAALTALIALRFIGWSTYSVLQGIIPMYCHSQMDLRDLREYSLLCSWQSALVLDVMEQPIVSLSSHSIWPLQHFFGISAYLHIPQYKTLCRQRQP